MKCEHSNDIILSGETKSNIEDVQNRIPSVSSVVCVCCGWDQLLEEGGEADSSQPKQEKKKDRKEKTLTYIDSAHSHPVHLVPPSQIKHGERHHSCPLVTICGFTADVTSGILTSADH